MVLISGMATTICQEHRACSSLLNRNVTSGVQPSLQETPNNTTGDKATLWPRESQYEIQPALHKNPNKPQILTFNNLIAQRTGKE